MSYGTASGRFTYLLWLCDYRSECSGVLVSNDESSSVQLHEQSAVASTAEVDRNVDDADSAEGGEEARRSHHQGSSLRRESCSQRVFQKRRKKSTLLLISIVATFALCNVYRLVLQFVKLSIFRENDESTAHYSYCLQRGRMDAPVVFRYLLMINHLCIVVNSSVNFVLYCVVGKEFRDKCQELFMGWTRKRSWGKVDKNLLLTITASSCM